jgi:Na+/proline symporter
MRALLAWLLPAVAAFAAWWLFLGTDADGQYSVAQVAGLVIVLLLVGVACGWLARRMELVGVIVSAVVGVAAGCWTDWAPDDDSGLFIIGWLMVVFGTAVFGTLLILVTSAVRRSRDVPAP